MAHLDIRGLLCLRRRRGSHRARRGRRGRGIEVVVEDEETRVDEERGSGVEVHAVLHSEAAVPLIIGERLAT